MLANIRPLDVTGTIRCDDPSAVAHACITIQRRRYGAGEVNDGRLFHAFESARRAYFGETVDWLICDTPYHDLRHALETALCAARLTDGYDASAAPEHKLGPDLSAVTTVLALLHDTGFLRRRQTEAGRDGARFMAEHEARSVRWVQESQLTADWPTLGEHAELIQATNLAPGALQGRSLDDPRLAAMANILGTADFLAQASDRYYLEKCRDFLFAELERAGMNRRVGTDGSSQRIYGSGNDLLRQTPAFFAKVGKPRLDSQFKGFRAMLAVHFGGHDPYSDAMERNLSRLELLISRNRLGELRRKPRPLPPAAQSKK